ncbi:hypothetical protein [Chlamydia vaughanii]|uniref:hypothetical protein n=1 Tax=Chlamydia vaughanii TaxID=3112552 RepID=UPI0032B2DC1B
MTYPCSFPIDNKGKVETVIPVSKCSTYAILENIALGILLIAGCLLTVFGVLQFATTAGFFMSIAGGVILFFLLLHALSLLFIKCTIEPPKEIPDTQEIKINLVKDSCIAFAESEIQKRGIGIVEQDWGGSLPPIDKRISYLAPLIEEKKLQITQILEEASRDGFEEGPTFYKEYNARQDFYKLVTEFLALSFAQSYFAIVDLPEYLQMHSRFSSYEEAITDPGSHYIETFYAMSTNYYFIRFLHRQIEGVFPRSVQKEYISSFYKKLDYSEEVWQQICDSNNFFKDIDEPEVMWKQMYNCFCSIVQTKLQPIPRGNTFIERFFGYGYKDTVASFEHYGPRDLTLSITDLYR